MKIATSPTSKGNPGQPRDLQFCGPFLEMFFDRAYPDFLPRSTGQGRVCAFSFMELVLTQTFQAHDY
jgi:hypothetical protein